MSKKVCSRCKKEHTDKCGTCDSCRSYNNSNKLVYHLARLWDMDPETVREGLRKALAYGEPIHEEES
jgi:predicted ATP-dependent serine protease